MSDNRPHGAGAPVAAVALVLALGLMGGPGIQGAQPPSAPEQLPELPKGRVWKMVWNDEFDGAELDASKWNRLGDKRRKKGLWLQREAYASGHGSAILRTEKVSEGFATGGIDTQYKYEKKFGYFVIRCRLSQTHGHWPAFWLMAKSVNRVGDDGRDGTEIDIFEAPWQRDEVNLALHWDGYGADKQRARTVAPVANLREGFHTFGLWWTAELYRFYVDGRLAWQTNAGGISQVPQYIKVTEEIGDWAADKGRRIDQARLPDYFEIDYVRVYDEVDR